MFDELETFLDTQIASIFSFLEVRYTQRFYKELSYKYSEVFVSMPPTLEERYNQKESARIMAERSKHEKYRQKEEVQFQEVMDQGWNLLYEKVTRYLDEDKQAELIHKSSFSNEAKQSLTQIIHSEEQFLVAEFLQDSRGIKLLEVILNDVCKVSLEETWLLERVESSFFENCPYDKEALYQILWKLVKFEDGESEERGTIEEWLKKSVKSCMPIRILEYLERFYIVKISERLIHFEGTLLVHLLLIQQILKARTKRERAALYRMMREEEIRHNFDFMRRTLLLLEKLDTESFNRYYFYPILREFFQGEEVDLGNPAFLYQWLGLEFTFSEEQDEPYPSSSSITPKEVLDILDALQLFYQDDFIPSDFYGKLDKLPSVNGFKHVGENYILELAQLDEELIKKWGFADTVIEFYDLAREIMEYLSCHKYKKRFTKLYKREQ